MKHINAHISEATPVEVILNKFDIDNRDLELVKVLMSGKHSEEITLGHNPSLQRYIVGVKPRTAEWARDASGNQVCPKICKARELYQEGRVEMVTEQTKDLTILYAIPRRIPKKPNNYFELENEKED